MKKLIQGLLGWFVIVMLVTGVVVVVGCCGHHTRAPAAPVTGSVDTRVVGEIEPAPHGTAILQTSDGRQEVVSAPSWQPVEGCGPPTFVGPAEEVVESTYNPPTTDRLKPAPICSAEPEEQPAVVVTQYTGGAQSPSVVNVYLTVDNHSDYHGNINNTSSAKGGESRSESRAEATSQSTSSSESGMDDRKVHSWRYAPEDRAVVSAPIDRREYIPPPPSLIYDEYVDGGGNTFYGGGGLWFGLVWNPSRGCNEMRQCRERPRNCWPTRERAQRVCVRQPTRNTQPCYRWQLPPCRTGPNQGGGGQRGNGRGGRR